ncbi:coiled-coil domain-containing protein 62 isoform X2 [Engraulis encrasicolus]|uniref:coiled-coil domain-containing protein 62 isoform X2 n=1 Tax=Engraulis encrasicolus TaxID=184585 RepID=UPI002FD234DA
MNPERCMDQPDTPRRPCLQSGEFPAEPWHSTPRKKFPSPREASRLQDVRSEQVARERDSMVGLGQQRSEPQQRRHDGHLPHPTALQQRHGQLPHSTSLPLTLTQNGQMSSDEVENSGPQRRRRELQLLMAELRERDDELNKMAAAHHAQLLAWQQDRQRTLQLEEKCARLQEELVQQDEALRAVGRRAKASEEQEKSSQRELRAAQTQLQELMHTQRHDTLMQNQQEERIQALDSTVTMLSSQVGQLQAREEELSTMLKLKDKDVIEAIVHIQDLSARLRSLDDSRAEWQSRESKLLIEVETLKRNYRDIRHENSRLKGELQEKTLENSTQREELIRLKQEAELLRRDLVISGEEESWKDEMLQLCRSKQERTEAELHGLRRVCDSQHNDLQLLTLNLERSEETLRGYERAHLAESQRRGQRSRDSQAEEVSSPRPGSPVFWTAISPIGHSRTIYHSSPTSADHCLSEVKVFSQDSNSPARFQEVNVSPARLQEVNVSPARIQEVGVSSTRRLQRLLEESRQMVSALEGLSLDVTSPSPSSPHSPAQHSRMAQALTNGHHDDSSVQDGSSEARSLNSSRENSFQTRRISSHRSQE